MLDVTSYVIDDNKTGNHQLDVVVSGIHCMSCVKSIENKLYSFPEIQTARVNMSAKRLSFTWSGDKEQGNYLLKAVNDLGFEAKPYVSDAVEATSKAETQALLKAMAVAGFAMGNIMLLSVAIWSNTDGQMGEATQRLFYWLSAIIAVPVLAYSGRPFFRSAFKALSQKQTNMDVPISLALLLATSLSLFELFAKTGAKLYFDSVVMLMFFLLIGRYLNIQARGKAKSAAGDLLSMMEGTATIINDDNSHKTIPFKEIKENMLLQVTAGEKIAADGIVEDGYSELDTSLLTGETMPQETSIGDNVFAGTINISGPLKIRVTKAGQNSLLNDIIKLMENAEQGNARFVRLSDRIAKLYTPVVHTLALLAFLFWYLIMGVGVHQSLIYAISLLIITCPCALGLAIPVVQVLASGRLFKKGILLKSGDALEKLAKTTTVFFDKTGTLTIGILKLINKNDISKEHIKLAASLARQSTHPLSKAITNAYDGKFYDLKIEDIAGHGLSTKWKNKAIKLGKRDWIDFKDTIAPNDQSPELWLSIGKSKPIRFVFCDDLRQDSKEVVSNLHNRGIKTHILSGDRLAVVEKIALSLGIKNYQATILPDKKADEINKEKATGAHVLMVGDGLNDAPALTSANVSISPATAMMITQNAADIVFQGDKLFPVLEVLETSIVVSKLTKQNLALAFIYNIFAIPLAFAGFVTPLAAAIVMSTSSIIVVLNSLRLNRNVNKRLNS